MEDEAAAVDPCTPRAMARAVFWRSNALASCRVDADVVVVGVVAVVVVTAVVVSDNVGAGGAGAGGYPLPSFGL